jgi:hypothetical protein
VEAAEAEKEREGKRRVGGRPWLRNREGRLEEE